jgi:hypothetical protein
MNAYGGVDVEIHIYLTSALAEGEWSASRPGSFSPVERVSGTHWIGGWVDDLEKRKCLTLPVLELRLLSPPSHSQPLYRLRNPAPLRERGLQIIVERQMKTESIGTLLR